MRVWLAAPDSEVPSRVKSRTGAVIEYRKSPDAAAHSVAWRLPRHSVPSSEPIASCSGDRKSSPSVQGWSAPVVEDRKGVDLAAQSSSDWFPCCAVPSSDIADWLAADAREVSSDVERLSRAVIEHSLSVDGVVYTPNPKNPLRPLRLTRLRNRPLTAPHDGQQSHHHDGQPPTTQSIAHTRTPVAGHRPGSPHTSTLCRR